MPTLPPFSLRAEVRQQLASEGQAFLADFLTRATQRTPDNLSALAELAHVLTRLGRLQEGLDADRKLVELDPHNPTFHYNLACSLTLIGDKVAALEALATSVALGYDDVEHLLDDEDLSALHEEAGFRTLVERLRATANGPLGDDAAR